jgi:hypothetical protein
MTSVTVVLHDEGTRRALESALWGHMGSTVTRGDGLDEDLRNAEVASLRRLDCGSYEETVTDVDAKVALLIALRAAVDRLRQAEVGTTYEMPMPATELASHLRHGAVPTIEEYEDFWTQPQEDREQMLGSRDGAARLLSDLESVEAVA